MADAHRRRNAEERNQELNKKDARDALAVRLAQQGHTVKNLSLLQLVELALHEGLQRDLSRELVVGQRGSARARE